MEMGIESVLFVAIAVCLFFLASQLILNQEKWSSFLGQRVDSHRGPSESLWRTAFDASFGMGLGLLIVGVVLGIIPQTCEESSCHLKAMGTCWPVSFFLSYFASLLVEYKRR